MTALLVAALLAALLAAGAVPAQAQMGHGAHGMEAEPVGAVSMLATAYAPTRSDVLVGDTLQWMNDSVRAHTVAAESGAWASARIASGESFRRRFDAPGAQPYYCTLHPFMRGEVDVHRVLLSAPTEVGAPGRPYVLHGRAAEAAGSTVAIEADTGAGFAPLAEAAVDAAGDFRLEVIPRTSTSYRAVLPEETSPAVQLTVLDRTLAAVAATRGRRAVVSATVTPASPGATVVLQLHLPQRFGWWPVARGKLDHHSRARFSLRLARRYSARVVLTFADGATRLAVSRTLRVGLTPRA